MGPDAGPQMDGNKRRQCFVEAGLRRPEVIGVVGIGVPRSSAWLIRS